MTMLHTRQFIHVLLAIVSLVGASVHSADFNQEVQAALQRIDPIREEISLLLAKGQVAESKERLLGVFPEAQRTPVESHCLANMLYSIDPAISYALQKAAAQGLPDQPSVQMEWALEQHRAGEYAGALASYDVFSKAYPDYAPIHGVAAECLLRLERSADAVARWQRSEEAKNGRLEAFESLVCAINGDTTAIAKRVALRARAQKGDVDAAVALIVLVSDYQHDWWNRGAHRSFLTNDLKLLDDLPPGPRIEALRCLGACLLASSDEDAAAKDHGKALRDAGLIIDDRHSLPIDSPVASLLIGHALGRELMTKEQARSWFLEPMLARARADKDVASWNVVAFLANPADFLAWELEAWKATGDVRFASGYLQVRLGEGNLKPDDAELTAAVRQFPDSAEIAHVQVACSPQPDPALLERAILAEYRHFTSLNPNGFVKRPGAWTLRRYFKALAGK